MMIKERAGTPYLSQQYPSVEILTSGVRETALAEAARPRRVVAMTFMFLVVVVKNAAAELSTRPKYRVEIVVRPTVPHTSSWYTRVRYSMLAKSKQVTDTTYDSYILHTCTLVLHVCSMHTS